MTKFSYLHLLAEHCSDFSGSFLYSDCTENLGGTFSTYLGESYASKLGSSYTHFFFLSSRLYNFLIMQEQFWRKRKVGKLSLRTSGMEFDSTPLIFMELNWIPQL